MSTYVPPKSDPKLNSDEKIDEKQGDKKPEKKKDLCRFYRNGKCRHNKDCRFDHPPIYSAKKQIKSFASSIPI